MTKATGASRPSRPKRTTRTPRLSPPQPGAERSSRRASSRRRAATRGAAPRGPGSRFADGRSPSSETKPTKKGIRKQKSLYFSAALYEKLEHKLRRAPRGYIYIQESPPSPLTNSQGYIIHEAHLGPHRAAPRRRGAPRKPTRASSRAPSGQIRRPTKRRATPTPARRRPSRAYCRTRVLRRRLSKLDV
jgi:hypothetical protein